MFKLFLDKPLGGGFAGAITGAAVGAAYAAWMYRLAYTGKCGCEGQQLISQYTQAQFILRGASAGAVFGAVFGALSAVGAGGVAIAALAGIGLSTIGIASSLQRIQSDSHNECAWLDLGFSVIGLFASGISLNRSLHIMEFYNKAVQNPGAQRTLIGEYQADSPLSYEKIAADRNLRHLNLKQPFYEMFKGMFDVKTWWRLINAPFIRSVAQTGDPVYLSTNPSMIRPGTNLYREYHLLLDMGYGEPRPVADPTYNLWLMTIP